jgi:hypothetical protein
MGFICIEQSDKEIAENNHGAAYAYLIHALEAGKCEHDAYIKLAKMYRSGFVPRNFERYIMALKQAVIGGTISQQNSANLQLVKCFTFGVGVMMNLRSAVRHAKNAKEDEILVKLRTCHCCGASGTHPKQTKYCKGCFRVRYCNIKCQRIHWKSGGHKELCDFITN